MKMHLFVPGCEETLCGRIMLESSTHVPEDVDCKSCRRAYEPNKEWYWTSRLDLVARGIINEYGFREDQFETVEMASGWRVPKACVDALDAYELKWPGASFPTARPVLARIVLDAAMKAGAVNFVRGFK